MDDKLYVQFRNLVLNRDGNRCQYPSCRYKGKKVEVHHIHKYADFPSMKHDINNGITLCKHHHYECRNKEAIYAPIFSKILFDKIEAQKKKKTDEDHN